MDLTDLTLRLLLLFVPGIICHLVVDTFKVHRERKVSEIVIFGFVYGLLSYLLYSSILFLFSFRFSFTGLRWKWPVTTFERALFDSGVRLSFQEIVLVTFVAFLQGVAICYIAKYSLHMRLARRCNLTNKFGDLNVWAFTMNLKDVEWAVVRDYEQNLMYYGYVRAYSDVDDPGIIEILLVGVTVYNERTGDQLYKTDKVYLSRRRDLITVDLPLGLQEDSTNV